MKIGINEQVERLDQALDALLVVRVGLGGLPDVPLPEEALDAALQGHEGFQAARKSFIEALTTLRASGCPDEIVFTIEAAAHELAGRAAEVGWALSMMANRPGG